MIPENTRPWFNRGTCQNLKTSPYILFIFLDDEESHWDAGQISDYWYGIIEPALAFIEKQAKEYRYDLKIDKGYYATGLKDLTVKFKGKIEKNLMESDVEKDLLNTVSKYLEFSSKHALHQFLKNCTHNDQIAYVILLNKDGRSYCMNERTNDPNYIEYCVVFRSYLGSTQSYASTLVHEILHLFGAEDYYDPYGRYPKRKQLAEKYYKNDIMLNVYTDIEDNEINHYTAYCLGWLEFLPRECRCDEWWE